jgi:hypothetical protein
MRNASIKLQKCEYDSIVSAVRFCAEVGGVTEHGAVAARDLVAIIGKPGNAKDYATRFRKAVATGLIELRCQRTPFWTRWSIDTRAPTSLAA